MKTLTLIRLSWGQNQIGMTWSFGHGRVHSIRIQHDLGKMVGTFLGLEAGLTCGAAR